MNLDKLAFHVRAKIFSSPGIFLQVAAPKISGCLAVSDELDKNLTVRRKGCSSAWSLVGCEINLKKVKIKIEIFP